MYFRLLLIFPECLLLSLGSGLVIKRVSWGQALPSGNAPFLPFTLKAFIWIRPDPDNTALDH